MPVLQGTEENIKKAAAHLQQNELVAFATETVYGLGANALEPTACEKIFAAKKRPKYDPLIIHIAEMYQLSELALEVPDVALDLAEAFWPGTAHDCSKEKRSCSRSYYFRARYCSHTHAGTSAGFSVAQ